MKCIFEVLIVILHILNVSGSKLDGMIKSRQKWNNVTRMKGYWAQSLFRIELIDICEFISIFTMPTSISHLYSKSTNSTSKDGSYQSNQIFCAERKQRFGINI
jgi:hypothetical protein